MSPKERGSPIADISLAHAEETAARHGDNAVAIALDVTKTASIEAAVESVVERWGGVDILVNNAAIFDMAPIVEVTEAELRQGFRASTSRACSSPSRRSPSA